MVSLNILNEVSTALEAYLEDAFFFYDGVFESDFDKNYPVVSD